MVIYKITNTINSKTYVGQTIRSLNERWKRHQSDCYKGLDYVLYRAMRKHGIENFQIEVIDRAQDKKELNKKEADWINSLKSMCYQNGYNMRGFDNRTKTSNEVRKKISNSLKKATRTYNTTKKDRVRIAKRANEILFTEHKKEWAIKNGSRYFNVYQAICIQKRSSKGIPSVYKKGEFVGTWLMATECSKDLNIGRRHIGNCLEGKRHQHMGYIFELKPVKGEG